MESQLFSLVEVRTADKERLLVRGYAHKQQQLKLNVQGGEEGEGAETAAVVWAASRTIRGSRRGLPAAANISLHGAALGAVATSIVAKKIVLARTDKDKSSSDSCIGLSIMYCDFFNKLSSKCYYPAH